MKQKRLPHFLLILLVSITAKAYDAEIDGIYYNFSGSTATVTYKSDWSSDYSGIVVIPGSVKYNGTTYSVTSIEKSAFSFSPSLTSVTIPNSVTSIGHQAFQACMSLTSIKVNSGNTVFDSRNNCNAIIETATNTLIVGCKNTIIPNSVTSIEPTAFMSCPGLISVTIPNTVTSIGYWAFYDCSGLISVTIPNSVTSIGSRAFSGCSGLTSIKVNSGNTVFDSRNNCNAIIETATNTLIIGCKTTIIPNSVTSIGDYAFMGCSGLTSITIPSSVTSISDDAFWDCSNLTSVKVDIGTPVSIANSTFPNRANATLIVPAGSKSAYEGADYWKEFKEIIEAEAPSPAIAFADANVKELCVANWDTNHDGELSEAEAAAVTDLGEVFNGNTTITSFNELQYFTGLTTIGNNAFDGCSSLTSIAIPSSLKWVKTESFKNCTSLSKVIVPDIAAWCGIIYEGIDAWAPLGNFPLGYAQHLYSDENTEITELVIPEGVTRIEPMAFRDAKYITSVTIPNSVTFIGEQAFAGMHRLSSIIIPQNVTTIEPFTFWDCQNLTSVTIPEGVITIGDNAFRDCTSLESVSLPESLKHLGGHSFLGCSALPSITIPDGITHLDKVAFQECSNLTTFTYNKAENELTKVDGVYQIGTAEDLCDFAILSTAANADICAQLTADIDYTGYTITGYSLNNQFQHIGLNGYRGTFDGNGHTITVNINNPDGWHFAALFRTLGKGGVIKNLRVAGHVESVSKFSAGIVSELKSGKVSHCVSDVDIVSNIDGDCTDGGIAGITTYDGQESIVEYCVVAGSIQGSNAHHRGGIISIGRDGNSENITIDNCLFVANVNDLDVTESNTFVRDPISSTHITNCYYLNAMGDASAGTQVTATQLASGELCWLLNGESCENPNWFQTLGEDNHPVPFNTHETVYKQEGIYTNTPLENTLYAADVSVCRGGKDDLPIILKNTENVRMFQFVLTLPEGLSIASENGELQAVLTDRAGTGHSLSCTRKDNGDYLFMVSQTNLEFFSGNSGDAVVKVKLAIPKDFALGDYQISMKDVELTLYRDGTNIPITPANSNSILTVNPKRRGDANGSGTVTVTDISVTVDIILEEGYDEGADANGNGKVTVTDIADIVDIILATSVSSRKTNNKLDPQ